MNLKKKIIIFKNDAVGDLVQSLQSINERIERLQDEMINVQMKLSEHDDRFKTRVKIKKDSTSVSGDIKNIFNS